MPLASRPLATAPLAGYVQDAIAQPAGALVIRQTVAAVQAEGAFALKQVVAQPQAAGELLIYQDVQSRTVQPVGALVLRQQVLKIQPAGQLRLLQNVITPAQQHVPPCYVIINGQPFTGQVSIQDVSIGQTEDSNATASFFAFFAVDVEVFVPSFNGKPVQIYTHADSEPVLGSNGIYRYPKPSPSNPLIQQFDGHVSTATHVHERRGIQFTCNDRRARRLGKEVPDQLRALTGGVFNEITQDAEATGGDYVAELMKTVPGSLCYTRTGELRYYGWGVDGKAPDWVITNADVHYRNLQTEFADADRITNTVTIKLQYRWELLRSLYTTVDARKDRIVEKQVGGYTGRDFTIFSRDAMIDRAQSLTPWETLSYSIYPATIVSAVWSTGSIRETDIEIPAKALGFKADLVRNIAQPVSEQYEITLRAPQSITAFGEEIPGSSYSWAVDVDYDESSWEDNFSHRSAARGQGGYAVDDAGAIISTGTQTSGEPLPLDQRIAAERAEADNQRSLLADVFTAAVAIGRKDLISKHRQNYITWVMKGRILPGNIGDIVDLQTRVPSTVGQIVGITWRFGDGIRETQIRIAIIYMDTVQAPPVEAIIQPDKPAITDPDRALISAASYNTETRALEISVAEIPEDLTNELEPDTVKATFDIALENTPITLINGH